MVIKYNYNGNIINSYNFLGYGDVSMKKIEIIIIFIIREVKACQEKMEKRFL